MTELEASLRVLRLPYPLSCTLRRRMPMVGKPREICSIACEERETPASMLWKQRAVFRAIDQREIRCRIVASLTHSLHSPTTLCWKSGNKTVIEK